MTLEHVLDPFEVSKSAFNLLRKGGVFITVTHNYESKVNRILHTKSPIIDIEHMPLEMQQYHHHSNLKHIYL